MSQRFLLDTHALAWFNYAPSNIPPALLEALSDSDNEVWVSSITAWELGLKFHLGKWPEVASLANNWTVRMQAYGFGQLHYTAVHALRAAALPVPHRDPFDRALMAQAITEGLVLVSADTLIAASQPLVGDLELRWD